MITKPLPFGDALGFILDKETLPAEWEASMWSAQERDFRTKAFFSARVENARFLQRAWEMIFDHVAGTTEEVVGPDGVKRTALRVSDRSHFVERMRRFMIEEGMAKWHDFKGVDQKDIEDIRSTSRLNLIFDTNVRQAYGYGQWKQGTTPAALKAFPAARLIRERGVREPRPRHQSNLGEVRLKTDPWWANYINDPLIGGFGVPWGPYGFNSGVNQEDVSQKEAEALGLEMDGTAAPDARITDGTKASTKKMDPALKARRLTELRGRPKARDPKEAAKHAARAARQDALARGMDNALATGDDRQAARYQRALLELGSPKVVDLGDHIELMNTSSDTDRTRKSLDV